MFIVPEANIPYKKSEQDAMLQYVRNGGSIFFIADHYNADRNKIVGTLLKYLTDIDAVLGIIQQKECLTKKPIHKLCKE